MSKFSVKKVYTVLVAVILVVVLGVVSFMKMSTDLLPSINLPYVIVMTTYVGASPETVEMVVTKPVESSMATVSNIESIRSVSSENYSLVILEFAQSADMGDVSLEIREKLDQIKSFWSDSVGNPIIMKMNPDMLPVMIAAVGMEGMNSTEISEYTESTVVPAFESIEGVASASATGLVEESVNVVIRQDKINQINKQVYGYIDDKLSEQEQEILDGEKELLDGQKELDDAQKELNDGKKELEDSKAELEDGKAELKKQKEENSEKLAQAEAQLLTAKSELEAAKVNITTQITTVTKMRDGINQARDGLVQINDGIAKLNEAITSYPTLISGLAQIEEGLAQARAGLEGLKGLIAGLSAFGDAPYGSLPAELRAQVESLLSTSFPDETPVSTIVAALSGKVGELEATIAGLEAQKLQIESAINLIKSQFGEDPLPAMQAQLAVLQSKKAEVEKTLANLESALNATTMGLGADAFINTMNETLKTINENMEKVDAGLVELYKGNLTAAVEFANAQTKIDFGEFQISSAEAQLESGEETLKKSREQLEDALDQLNEGKEKFEEAKDDAYNNADMNKILTVETVEGLLAAQNFSMPSGYVTEDGVKYLVRVGDKPEDIEELKKMPILNPQMDGVDVITLADVADVFITDNTDAIYANLNGTAGVMLSIQKQTGYSTGDVTDRLNQKIEQMKKSDDRLEIITLMDQGIYIDLVMDSVLNNILVGAVLAVLILLLFLKDIKPTIIIACSIPVSVIAAVVCMYFSGVTLNVISLSGLALGIGMLVDNSIVVIENIYRFRSLGYSMIDAAIEGSKEVAGAIAASTLTTVCVFLPIVFTEGITRQLFVDMGLTIAYSLGASLLIALTVVPAMASKMLKKVKETSNGKLLEGILFLYEKILRISLKWKAVVFAVTIVLLVLSGVLAIKNGIAFMPNMDSTQMSMSIKMEDGTPLAETAAMTDEIIERLNTIPEITDIGAMVSGNSYAGIMGVSASSETDATDVYLVLDEHKKRTNIEIADEIYAMTEDLEGVEIQISTSDMDMSALSGEGITINIKGRDTDTLVQIASEVADIVATVEGTDEVSNGMEDASQEYRVTINKDKAMEYGLTVAQVFQQLAAKLSEASSATTFETATNEYDVFVKNKSDMELTRQQVNNIMIKYTDSEGKNKEVELYKMADFMDTEVPASINRIAQSRYISVTASIAEGYNVGLVSQDVTDALKNYRVPDGYEMEFAGENEMIIDAMEQVGLMMLLAVIFIYLIMVAQFQSLLAPFIIMFTIPLAFTGGFFGLAMTGSEVSVIALIGFVMLAGIIVNNGIVLVDYINQLREESSDRIETIVTAGKTRLRPVLMTALTTILALSTMALGTDMGSEMSKPMAVVTIGGLIYGTLLTLIVVPCIYDVFFKVRKEEKND